MTDHAERCVACGQTASERNTYPDATGAYTLIRLPKFALCESCVPTCSETMIPQDSDMEPEEAVLRCWFSAFKNRSVPFDELAEQLMNRESAVLASARERVEALCLPMPKRGEWRRGRWRLPTPEPHAAYEKRTAPARHYNAGLAAAARAITEAT